MTIFSVIFGYLNVCVYSTNQKFIVDKFIYIAIYIGIHIKYMVILNWSLNFKGILTILHFYSLPRLLFYIFFLTSHHFV